MSCFQISMVSATVSCMFGQVKGKADDLIVYDWTFQGIFTAKMQVPANRMAFVALVALDVLCFFSTSFWRRKAYYFFFAIHMICFCVFLPMVSLLVGANRPH